MKVADTHYQSSPASKTALVSETLPWGLMPFGIEDANGMIDSESSIYMALEALVQSTAMSLQASAGWIALSNGRTYSVVGSLGFPFPQFVAAGSPEEEAVEFRGITRQDGPSWRSEDGQLFPPPGRFSYVGCKIETVSGLQGVLSFLFSHEVDSRLAGADQVFASASSARFILESAEIAVKLRIESEESKKQNDRLIRRLQDLEVSNTDLQVTKGALETQNTELRDLADLDGATGLLNQRAFYQELTAKLKVGSETAVAIIDVDNFKAYNDQFGHLAGDDILRRLGNLLREECGLDSLAARYGGEEFAIIFGSKSSANALPSIERIRKIAEGMSWPHRQITFTAGIAKSSPTITNARELVHRADQALYVGKRSGKNKVLSWE